MAGDSIPEKMVISLAGKRALYKGDLMMLEIIAECNWVRPIYVASTVGSENYMNLGENFVQEGLAYRITPFSTSYTNERGDLVPIEGMKQMDTEKTYNNVMKRYKYGGLDRQHLYLDETIMRMCYTHRNLMATLAKELIYEGKKDKALEVLQKCEKEIPYYIVPVNFRSGSFDMAQCYALLGKKPQATLILNQLWKNATQYLDFYLSLNDSRFALSQREYTTQIYVLQRVSQIAELVDPKLADKMNKQLHNFYNDYSNKGGGTQ